MVLFTSIDGTQLNRMIVTCAVHLHTH